MNNNLLVKGYSMLGQLKKIDIWLSRRSCNILKVLFKYVAYILNKLDPIIEYRIYNIKSKMPYSHSLPNILAAHKLYSTNLKRIVDLCKSNIDDFSLIDIGANIGDTVLLLENKDNYPILLDTKNYKFHKSKF